MKFGLYIHIPFCPYKCNYCDFLTFANADRRIEEYMSYLFKEIELYRGKGYQLDTVFIGGGTPSYLDSTYIERLMDLLREVFIIDEDAEISIEMNPNTLDSKKIRTYLDSGINRYSLGVQTFDDEILNILGRKHSKEIAIKDIEMLRRLGAKNISIDMMLANPKQDMEILAEDLKTIRGLDLDHISYYTLILEDRTLFKYWVDKGLISLIDDDLERDMFDLVKKDLFEMGFKRYEISNFYKNGRPSRHNMKYWKQEPYLAVGLGAVGMYDSVRRKNFRSFEDYYQAIDQARLPVEEEERLSKEDLEKEYIIMSMRMVEGFSIEEINRRFDIDFLDKYKEIIDKYEAYGIVKLDGGKFTFTDYGLDVANQFYVEII